MTYIQIINNALALGTVAAHILIILGVIYFFFFRKKYPQILENLGRHNLLYAFIIALVATCGSLYFSKIAGYNPCELCWYQRIFVYPQVLLLGVALYKKDNNVVQYALPLVIASGLISLYHVFGSLYQTFGSAILKLPETCGAVAGGSCLIFRVLAFGYITIPIMSLTASILLAILLLLPKIIKK